MSNLSWIVLGTVIIIFVIYNNSKNDKKRRNIKKIRASIKNICNEYANIKFSNCKVNYDYKNNCLSIEVYFIENKEVTTDKEIYQDIQRQIKDTVETILEMQVINTDIRIKKLNTGGILWKDLKNL